MQICAKLHIAAAYLHCIDIEHKWQREPIGGDVGKEIACPTHLN